MLLPYPGLAATGRCIDGGGYSSGGGEPTRAVHERGCKDATFVVQ